MTIMKMKMSCKSLLFFGDGSQEMQTALSQILLSQKQDSLLASFLTRARSTLQDEYMKLSESDRHGIPDFRDLYCLLRQPGDENPPHPALHPVEITLVQLASFIAAYERQPQGPYPDPSCNLIIGICIGELTAAAVSLASSVTDLLPIAVETIRVAFKIGIAVSIVGNELEQRTFPQESWSVSISRDCGITDSNALERVCCETGILERSRPFFTSLGRKTISLGGPPSTLRRLLEHIDKSSPRVTRHCINIFAPYHAPHLFSREDVDNILGTRGRLTEIFHTKLWPEWTSMLVEGVSGRYYSASSRRDLLSQVAYNILARPVYWENIIEGCKFYLKALKATKWIVRPFGPTTAAKSLAEAFKPTTGFEVILDAAFGLITPQMSTPTKSPIAIIGMAGRFPKADNPDALWDLLEKGIDCHTEIPKDRFDPETHLRQPAFGCFLDKPGLFDARFFSMSPREALQTDPGQRLSLITAYEALEMSGYVPNGTPSTRLDRIGTFYGQVADEYKEQNMSQDVGTYFIPGSMRAFGPGRINHYFKFSGPAFIIDTACSSSAAALHVACNSIWTNECDTAVVGGTNILSSSDNYAGLSAGYFLSPTGGCKTFDNTADGYCRGEAVGTIVIKRLDAAQADNDNILGAILSTTTNHTAGSTSITRPHGATQEALYRRVLHEAGTRPFEVDYVEMHGTGTQAGDTVEMNAILNVFAPDAPSRSADNPLYVSAVKSNVGHGESASGVTALIKTLLILREQRLPPHVGIKTSINHAFPDLAKRNLHIPFASMAFPSPSSRGGKRRVLVNNFSAAGGSTACIIEEFPSWACNRNRNGKVVDLRPHHVVSITAKSAFSLLKNTENLLDYLVAHAGISLSDLSYTTTARRIQHPLRISAVVSTINQLRERLISLATNVKVVSSEKLDGVSFVFTGQGSVYSSLGKEFYEMSSQFRSDMIRFDNISQEHGFMSFLPLVDGTSQDLRALTPTQTQLGIVAVQLALSGLYQSWGVRPNLVIGHSLGEYAALCVSGVLSINDTLYLVGQRAKLMETKCGMKTHSMLSISASIESVNAVLLNDVEALDLACINGRNEIVLAGPVEYIGRAEKLLAAESIKCKILDVPFAYHSSQMDSIATLFEEAAQQVTFRRPKIPIVSPLLGIIINDHGVISPTYLRRHAREAVNFYGAIRRCQTEGLTSRTRIWLELGPHPVCVVMIKSILGDDTQVTATLHRNKSPWTTACESLSQLHTLGYNIVWKEYHRDFESGQRLLDLPTYAFDYQNYWIEYKNDWLLNKWIAHDSTNATAATTNNGPRTTTVQRLVLEEINDGKLSLAFESDLTDPELHAVISGHLINGSGLCPASVYADIALTIADYIRRTHNIQNFSTGLNIAGMEILKPIIVPKTRPETPQILHISASADLAEGVVQIEYHAHTRDTNNKSLNAKCLVAYGDANKWLSNWSRTAYLVQNRIKDLESGLSNGATHRIFRNMAYKLFSSLVHYGENYQGMQEVLLNSDDLESVASLNLYEAKDAGSFFCSPFWIDSFAHLSGFIINTGSTADSLDICYISHGWESMRFAQVIDPKKSYRVHVKMHPLSKTLVSGDATIFQGNTMMGLIKGIKFQQVPRSLLNSLLPPPVSAYRHVQPQNLLEVQETIKLQRSSNLSPISSANPVGPTTSQTPAWNQTIDIIAHEIGIPTNKLSDNMSFSAAGIDSLLSLSILSRIRELYQMALPPTLFEDYPTVGDLERYIRQLPVNAEPHMEFSNTDSTLQSSAGDEPKFPPSPQAQSSDHTLSTLRSAVAEQIGVEVNELLAAKDLSTLGMDSLMSLSVTSTVREKLGISLSHDIINGESSMQSIERSLGLSPPIQVLLTEQQAHPVSKARGTLSVLLQGNPKLASETLFLLPDGSGSATSYARLPEVSPNLCIFGLNSPFLRAGREVIMDLENLIVSWVAEIRSLQPRGPYILGGWSSGGYYAFEATKKLLQAGERVDKLILIDSPPRNVYESMPLDVLDFVAEKCIMCDNENPTSSPQWLVEHFEVTLRAVDKYIPSAITSPHLPRTFIIWASDSICKDLNVTSLGLDLNPKITQFLFRDKTDFEPFGWDRLLPGADIVVMKMPGNHFSIVRPPSSAILSSLIADIVG